MIRAAIGFFVLSLLAYVMGAYGLAGFTMEIARILLGVFLVLAVISLVMGISTRGALKRGP